MEPEEIENLDSEIEETVEDETVEEEAPETDEEKEALKAKVAELESKNKQLFERTKKVEKKEVPKDISNADILFLAKADIHEDDMDEVLDWAKFKKVSVKEAHAMLKDTLAVRDEQRRTQEATNTGSSRKGTNKIVPADILQKARTTGEVPDSDEAMTALFLARQAEKFNK